jgi:hypothetical protein
MVKPTIWVCLRYILLLIQIPEPVLLSTSSFAICCIRQIFIQVSCSAGCDVIDRCEGRARGLKFNYAENLSVVDSANRCIVQVFVEIQGDPNT